MGTRDTTADSVYRSHVAGAPRENDSIDHDERDLSGPEAPLSRDDVFDVLRDARRRTVLQYLITERGKVPLSTLAAYVAAVEHETTDGSASVGEMQSRVRVSLHHSHLPGLDEAGVVDYDPATRTVEPNPLVGVFEPFLAEGTGPGSDLLIGGS